MEEESGTRAEGGRWIGRKMRRADDETGDENADDEGQGASKEVDGEGRGRMGWWRLRETRRARGQARLTRASLVAEGRTHP